MNSLKDIEDNIMELTSNRDRCINGLWSVDCLYNPSNNGRVFDYKFLVAQTIGQGCSYSVNYDYSRDKLKSYIGHDFSELKINDLAFKVSLFDSIYGELFPVKNKEQIHMNANSSEKLKWRTKIIKEEAIRLLGRISEKTIVNVGVVGDILLEFKKLGAYVTGTDFDKSIIGNTSFGVPVKDGENTLEILKTADLAVITGMTISTGTIDSIINTCLANNVRIIVFAETGANLADYYIKHGVDVYLSEYFPFYIFNGCSYIDICRAI